MPNLASGCGLAFFNALGAVIIFASTIRPPYIISLPFSSLASISTKIFSPILCFSIIYHRLIRQIEPVLYKIHAEHQFDFLRPSAALIILIIRLDQVLPLIHGMILSMALINSLRRVLYLQFEYARLLKVYCFIALPSLLIYLRLLYQTSYA